MLANRLPAILFWNPWLEAYFKWVKSLNDFDPIFRHGYIQHPSEIPLIAKPKKLSPKTRPQAERVNNGLCFESRHTFPVNSNLEIMLSLNGSEFKADATVVWVEADGDMNWVGVNFSSAEASYSMRMAEQICQIEHYRQDVLTTQGRALSQEEAAIEWVERYAASFPASI